MKEKERTNNTLIVFNVFHIIGSIAQFIIKETPKNNQLIFLIKNYDDFNQMKII